MPSVHRLAACAAGVATVAVMAAAPVSAAPTNPCAGALIPVCLFVPIFPELDHDIDLTQNPDALTAPDVAPPADVVPPAEVTPAP